ncbi:MAG: hypothetical protein HYR88_18660, partial [Verrucomicrobia bacterium]|nr:hypothetical protein [Verrucomicrobiota bacterium]
MKTLLVRSILGGLLLSSPLWWAGSAAAETHNINGQVTAVQGSATLSVPGQPETPLKPGADVPPGAVIHTSPGGSVDVFLGRNTGVIRVAENSALKVRALQVTDTGSETVTDTQLELQK